MNEIYKAENVSMVLKISMKRNKKAQLKRGSISLIELVDQFGNVSNAEQYNLDGSGSLQSIKWFEYIDSTMVKSSFEITYGDKNQILDSTRFVYDSTGTWIESIFYAEGKIKSKDIRIFDDGNLVSTIRFQYLDKRTIEQKFQHLFEKDEDGRVIWHAVLYEDGDLKYRDHYLYNNFGLVITILTENALGEVTHERRFVYSKAGLLKRSTSVVRHYKQTRFSYRKHVNKYEYHFY